ncbi:terpene synthase family protein [Streptomyces sp. NPDC042319]|uniref:terpene synthase family protein n=1 Tax=Streptomyces sp. NPDC042319 TaxID=3154332 RepID=UPI0033F6673A
MHPSTIVGAAADHDQRAAGRPTCCCTNAGACEPQQLAHIRSSGLISALIGQFPVARTDYLQLFADLTVYTFLWDDALQHRLRTAPRAETLAELLARVSLLERPEVAPEPTGPWRQAFRDIARRAQELMPPDRYASWEAVWLRAYLGDCWEVFLLDGDHRPSPDEYLTLRRNTFGLAACTDVLDLVHQRPLTDEERKDPQVEALTETAEVITLIDDDIYSAPREALTDQGGGGGIISVLADHYACDQAEALARTVALRNRILALHVKPHSRLSQDSREAVTAYARDVGQLVRVVVDIRFTNRYTAPYLDGRGAVPVSPTVPAPTTPDTAADTTPPPLPSFDWWWATIPA